MAEFLQSFRKSTLQELKCQFYGCAQKILKFQEPCSQWIPGLCFPRWHWHSSLYWTFSYWHSTSHSVQSPLVCNDLFRPTKYSLAWGLCVWCHFHVNTVNTIKFQQHRSALPQFQTSLTAPKVSPNHRQACSPSQNTNVSSLGRYKVHSLYNSDNSVPIWFFQFRFSRARFVSKHLLFGWLWWPLNP